MASAEPRGRWALLIGIDCYPNFSQEWQLEGCGNDVAIFKDVLVRRFQFSEERITVLRDEQATRVGILAAMNELVERAGHEDEVVFYYSGHGSQQKDGPEKDEADGKDETLVPYDSGRAPFDNQDISDDEIYLWLLRLTAKTPFVTLILDCCHSGTILRDAFAGKQRAVPEDVRPAAELAARIPPESYELLKGGEDSPAATFRLGQKYVALASCGSVETSNEMRVGEARPMIHGALTYFLVETLLDTGCTGATWREVFERVVPRVTSLFRGQHPEVEGARDREVFGFRDLPPMKYLPVERCEGETIVLGGGKVCGVQVGGEWAVYEPATRQADPDKFLGTVEVFEVGVTSSKVRALESTRGEEKVPAEKVRAAIHPGCRGVELVRPISAARLSVEIVAPAGHREVRLLERSLEDSLFLEAASLEKPAEARVYLLEPRTGWDPSQPAPMLKAIPEETWVPIGKDGDLLAPIFPCGYPEALEGVVENLENVARRRGLIGIRNAGSPLAGEIDFSIYRLDGTRLSEPSLRVAGDPVFFEGERLVLEIRNRSLTPLYIYVLDLGLTGSVSSVYPPVEGAGEVLEGGRSILAGVRRGQELELMIPQGFQYLHQGADGEPIEGLETLILFATPNPADFGPLHQKPMRDAHRSTWNLNDALALTFHGGTGHMRTTEDWVTIQRTFRLRSRNGAQAAA